MKGKLICVTLVIYMGIFTVAQNNTTKWRTWSENRMFYLVRNSKLDFQACKFFCEVSERASLAMFWDTVNPWFEDSGILKQGKRYWVQKKEPTLYGNKCHYLSGLGHPRGHQCQLKYSERDRCKQETLYRRLVLQTAPCSNKYGCICQRRI